VDEVLRVVQAVQHVDKHGEVCPANWKPTDAAINPKKAQDFFAKMAS
jgi:alkyl hydroperoxide reductase subunit AhpC